MKKILCLSLVLLFTVSLFGCVDGYDVSLAEDSFEAETESDIEIDYDNLVTDALSEVITYDGTDYEFNIPQINIGTDYVEDLNEEIFEDLNEFYESRKDDPAQYGGGIGTLTYEWYVNGDILSLVTRENYMLNTKEDFDVYNIIISKGEEVEESDVFEAAGVDEETYRQMASDVLGYQSYIYLASMEPIGETTDDDWYFWQTLESYYMKAISEDNLDDTEPYLNANGELCFVGTTYVLAAAEVYERNFVISEVDIPDEYYVFRDKYAV